MKRVKHVQKNNEAVAASSKRQIIQLLARIELLEWTPIAFDCYWWCRLFRIHDFFLRCVHHGILILPFIFF